VDVDAVNQAGGGVALLVLAAPSDGSGGAVGGQYAVADGEGESRGRWLSKTGMSDAIRKAAEVAPTPEHQAIIGTFEDSKDGAELPGLAALGEYVAPVAEKSAKPKKTAAEKPDEAPAAVVEG
jgi:hypothetical protein